MADCEETRSDLLDYLQAAERFDRDTGEVLKLLEAAGQLDNTLVVMTSDNGLPFPRAKANLYDAGTRMPLAIRCPALFKGGRTINDLVSHVDFAPTFLELAGVKVPAAMTGRSFLSVLTSNKDGQVDPARDRIFSMRERHAWVRRNGLGYPSRALRTRDFLFIRNYEPDRWPAGDPDLDGGGSATSATATPARPRPGCSPTAKPSATSASSASPSASAPREELYDLKADPDQLNNVADRPEYAPRRAELSAALDAYLKETKDPRAIGGDVPWDTSPYYGAK